MSDCLLWTLYPPNETDLQRGINVTISWDYELEENEALLTSSLKGNNVDIAQRTAKTNYIIINREGTDNLLIVSEFSNVSLTIINATISKKYCCHVYINRKGGTESQDKESCTQLNLYGKSSDNTHTVYYLTIIRRRRSVIGEYSQSLSLR